MELKGAEIFAVGTWNGREFSESDLDGMASSFDALGLAGRIPLKLGHDGDDARDGAPALGWVARVWREGGRLLADFKDLPKLVYDGIKAGLYRFVSVELLRDVQADTRIIPWVIDAVALLGATQPAVGILGDLQALTMAQRPALRFVERIAFTREGGTEAELRQQIAALQRQLLDQQIETDVGTGRVLPRERELFNRRFGDSGTLADWRTWIRDVPRPDPKRFQPHTFERPRDGVQVGNGRADEEVRDRALQFCRDNKQDPTKHNVLLAAMQHVLRSDPELADRYKRMPSELWGGR
jgi:hypothetical protein